MAPAPVPVGHDAKTWNWPLQLHDRPVAVKDRSDRFEVLLDVQPFKSDEVEVKVTGDEVLIHCKHEDNGEEVAREILRAYHLPQGADTDSVKSYVSRGRLQITASKKH